MKSSRRVIKASEVQWGSTVAFKLPAPLPSESSSREPEERALPRFKSIPAEVVEAEPPNAEALRQSFLAEAEAERERLLQAAREQAAEIERLARAQAAEFEQLANEQAEQVVRTAKEQAAEVTGQARREGYEAAEADAGQLLLAAQGVLDEVRAWRATIFAQSEQAVLNLVAHIAKVIFGEGVVLSREALEAAFGRAVAEARPLGGLRIHIHPDDAALLNPIWAQQVAPTGQRLELATDEAIRRGGCLVEGESGSVDGRVETQLHLALETLTSEPQPAVDEKTGESPA